VWLIDIVPDWFEDLQARVQTREPLEEIVTISHVHCRVKDLPRAVEWFASRCGVRPNFSDARLAVLVFGEFTLILDRASEDSVATIGFNSHNCNADFDAMVGRGAQVLEPPSDRPYGARVAYLRGPGALTIEIEQMLDQTSA